jgi:hypothetical protein
MPSWGAVAYGVALLLREGHRSVLITARSLLGRRRLPGI